MADSFFLEQQLCLQSLPPQHAPAVLSLSSFLPLQHPSWQQEAAVLSSFMQDLLSLPPQQDIASLPPQQEAASFPSFDDAAWREQLILPSFESAAILSQQPHFAALF